MKLILLTLVLLLQGCSVLYSTSPNLPSDIDKLIAEKKYRKAINIINYIKPGYKHYKILQKKKKQIFVKVNKVTGIAVRQSLELASQGEWAKAFNYLDEITENLPPTEKLKRHRNNLLLRRDHAISEFSDKLLTIEARNLSEKYELYEKIRKTVPENEKGKFNFKEFDSSRNQTAYLLARRSERQFSKGNHEAAMETILLAKSIYPEENTLSRLNTVKKLIENEKERAIKEYITQSYDLLNKLSQGYSHSILHETHSRIRWINERADLAEKHSKLVDNLKAYLEKGVKQYFRAGQKLYSKGKIAEARAIWLDLEKLAPDYPGLEANLLRADNVLKKLKQLKKKSR